MQQEHPKKRVARRVKKNNCEYKQEIFVHFASKIIINIDYQHWQSFQLYKCAKNVFN